MKTILNWAGRDSHIRAVCPYQPSIENLVRPTIPSLNIHKMAADISKHAFVPKHMKVNDSEKEKLCAQYNVNPMQLPKIMKEDPAISTLSAKVGDIIKVERHSKTAGVVPFYRVVVDG